MSETDLANPREGLYLDDLRVGQRFTSHTHMEIGRAHV